MARSFSREAQREIKLLLEQVKKIETGLELGAEPSITTQTVQLAFVVLW